MAEKQRPPAAKSWEDIIHPDGADWPQDRTEWLRAGSTVFPYRKDIITPGGTHICDPNIERAVDLRFTFKDDQIKQEEAGEIFHMVLMREVDKVMEDHRRRADELLGREGKQEESGGIKGFLRTVGTLFTH